MISGEIENRLSKEMTENLKEYYASLHACKENSRQTYVFYLRKFSRFLVERGITRFEDANARDLDVFLANYDKTNTLNNYIRVLKAFYKFLKLEAPVSHLKEANAELPLITPADVLTPEEIIKLGEEAGHRRVMYKYLTYIAFESCARANEYLTLRVGDVVFSSVRDKEGQRMLIATLYFKRAKGGVNKQPVTLTMFAVDLKQWVDNHPLKGDKHAFLFPSPRNPNSHVSDDTFSFVLWGAAERLGIKKRVNPHWLRHSGLSYCSNHLNYNEQLLMWRTGWKNTTQCKRYIHSGAELEAKAY